MPYALGAGTGSSTTTARLSLKQQRMLLPIAGHRRQVLYALERHQVLVLVGATGSGKSTQIPQFLDEAGWTAGGRLVGVTQPRRVAATTVAARVAQEMSCELGTDVGYSVRFDERSDSHRTRIKFLTDGMLLRETMRDPLLSRYSVIMLDEAHERSVATDVLMGLLKKLLRRRPELRLIVASATLDAERFADFFEDVRWENPQGDSGSGSTCILTVEGRQFPVDVFYAAQPVADYLRAAVDTVLHIAAIQPVGDVLVFLCGREEIDRVVSMLREEADQSSSQRLNLRVLPLYAGLPLEQQTAVFEPPPYQQRKVVVSTNVAEASVTIDGIAYVVDAGFAKQRHFDPASGTSHLHITPISQQSANQRAGRSGRTRKGVCYRLYTEADFHARLPLRSVPELQRSNLVSVLLQLKALGVDNLLRFDWMDPPPLRQLIKALELLHALGALDSRAHLTPRIGRFMAEMPLDPNLARMLLYSAGVREGSGVGDEGSAADEQHFVPCSEEVLTIVSMLSVDNLFLPLPSGVVARSKAEAARLQFAVHEGDHLSLLNLFTAFLAQRKKDPAAWAKRHYVNLRALARALDIRRQLRSFMLRLGIPLLSCSNRPTEANTAIRKALVAGYFMNAAQLQPDGTYKPVRAAGSGSSSRKHNNSPATGVQPPSLHIHPSSVLHATTQSAAPKPAWLVYHELTTTTKAYMREVSIIDPSWLVALAPHYFELRSGHQADVERQQALAKAVDSATIGGVSSVDASETDGVVGEEGKAHRRLF